MTDQFTCWQCGEKLTGVILPMSRREECAHCGADQHVCKMCEHFDDRGGWGSCTEERAETVSDTERANFCDYFSPSDRVNSGSGASKSEQAKAELAALFGDEPEPTAGKNTSETEEKKLSPAEIAERKLREMLGGGD